MPTPEIPGRGQSSGSEIVTPKSGGKDGLTVFTVFESVSGVGESKERPNKFSILDKEGKPTEEVFDFLEIFGLELNRNSSLKEIVDLTQIDPRFIQKDSKTGKRLDRWKYANYFTDPEIRSRAMPYLDGFGLVGEIRPVRTVNDYCLVQGGHAVKRGIPRIVDAINYYKEYDTSFGKNLVLLGSKRALMADEKEALSDLRTTGFEVRKDWQPPKNEDLSKIETEFDMMKYVWESSDLHDDESKKIKLIEVNAEMKPRSDGEGEDRAITDDTAELFMEQKPVGTYVEIINNPYTFRMALAFDTKVLKAGLQDVFKGEAVGRAASPDETMAIYLGEFARLLYQTQEYQELLKNKKT